MLDATVVLPDGREEIWGRGLDWSEIVPTTRFIFDDLAMAALDDIAEDIRRMGHAVTLPRGGPKVGWRGADAEAEALVERFQIGFAP
jgi:hypothetical protein